MQEAKKKGLMNELDTVVLRWSVDYELDVDDIVSVLEDFTDAVKGWSEV